MRTQCLSANTPLICRKEFGYVYWRECRDPDWSPEICYLCKRHSYFHAGILGFIYKIQSDFHHRLLYFSNALFMTWSMEVSNVFRPVFIPTPKPTASIRYPKRKRNSSPSISGYYTTEPLRQLIYLQKNLLPICWNYLSGTLCRLLQHSKRT